MPCQLQAGGRAVRAAGCRGIRGPEGPGPAGEERALDSRAPPKELRLINDIHGSSDSDIRVTSRAQVLPTGLGAWNKHFSSKWHSAQGRSVGAVSAADAALVPSAAGPAPGGGARTSPLAEDRTTSHPIHGGGHAHPDFRFFRRETYPRTGRFPGSGEAASQTSQEPREHVLAGRVPAH